MSIFGGVRRSAFASLALVIATSGLMVVGAASPATAGTIYPCTASVGGWGDVNLPERPDGYGQVKDAVLTVNVDDSYLGRGDLEIFATADGPSSTGGTPVATISGFASPGPYAFSTSANSSPWDPVREPGTYGAGSLRQTLDPYPFTRRLSVRVMQNRTFEREISFQLDLVFERCDSDGDERPDNVDNCPTLANLDQRDFDRDGAGDACDADDDGDGAADTRDNCAMLANSDQTDSDGDAVGNACDSTPFPPAPPTGTTTGSTTTGPTPVSTTGPVAGQPVAAARTMTLKYAKRKRFFRGAVTSELGSCAAYAEASLWRKKRGADRRLAISTTDEAGKFRTPKVRKRGKYYATIEANPDSSCAGVRSSTVRIRRR